MNRQRTFSASDPEECKWQATTWIRSQGGMIKVLKTETRRLMTPAGIRRYQPIQEEWETVVDFEGDSVPKG